MADLILNVDIKQALAALKRLSRGIDDTAKEAEKGFDRSAFAAGRARDEFGRFIATGTKGSKTLGTAIGGIAGPIGIATVAVGALGFAFVELARVATTAFIDITKGGILLNKEAELTRLSLIQIFEGNEAAADAFIDTIGDLAIRLGTSRQELIGLAKGILPDVGGIEATAELLENVIVLGRDAGQNIQSIRIATEEALSGNLTSLGRRLNIPRTTLDSIREYQKEMSLADAINRGLKERIEKTGISADITADSFTTLQGKIEGNIEGFQKILGEAPFEELKEQSRDFLLTLDEQGESIGFVAEAFGDLAANVIDFIGTNINEFVASIDFEAVERLVDSFNRALSAAQLVVDVLFELPDTAEGIDDLAITFVAIQGVLEDTARLADRLKIALQLAFVAAKALFQITVSRDFVGAIETLTELGDVVSLENQAKSAQDTADAFEDYEKRIKSLDEAQEKRRDTTGKSTQADVDAGEAIIANKKALEELAAAQAEAATAQETISKKTTQAEEDRAKRLTNLLRKEANRRFDDAIKAAQRQEDIARKNADAIEDIFRKQDQAISDASKDLSREEQDIARNATRDRKDIETQAANERLDIERRFRQELERIQRQFTQSALDAERNNDAQAFIQAIRARDEQIEVATSERDVSVVDTGRQAQQQREELKVQLAAEVEDARISNARKLEDLQANLDRSLEAQAIKLERELEQEAIKEQRLTEQRILAAQRDLEQFERSEADKATRLQESLATQFALIEAAKTKELAFTARIEAEKTAIVQAEVAKRQAALASLAAAQRQAGPGALQLAPTRGDLGFGRPFGAGGRFSVGEPIVVGDKGPEMLIPDSAGTIIPNNAIFSPPPAMSPLQSAPGGNNFTNNSTFNLAESMFTDPIARQNLENFVLVVLAKGTN